MSLLVNLTKSDDIFSINIHVFQLLADSFQYLSFHKGRRLSYAAGHGNQTNFRPLPFHPKWTIFLFLVELYLICNGSICKTPEILVYHNLYVLSSRKWIVNQLFGRLNFQAPAGSRASAADPRDASHQGNLNLNMD